MQNNNNKQVDVLPSKNQALCNCYCNSNINDVTGKSHEQRLITREHIATHTNLIPSALYSSTLVIKL